MLNLKVVCITAALCGTLGFNPIATANTAVARTAVAVGVGLRASVVPLRNGVTTKAQGKVAKYVAKKVNGKNKRKKAQKQRRRYVLFQLQGINGWVAVARFKAKFSACASRGIHRTKYVGKNTQFIVRKKDALGKSTKVIC